MGFAVSRRQVLKRALAGTSAAVVGESLVARSALADPTLPPLPAQVAGTGTVVDSALPSAKHLERDVQRMVDFGPRLTGSDSQNAYLDWLEKEFARAGCQILPRKTHAVELWEAQDYGLSLLQGPNPGPVHVSSYFPRSGETPAGGVEGELVYCGAVPPLQISANDPTNPVAALQRFVSELPDALQALLDGLPAGSLQGNVALIDLPFPPPLTEAWLSFELTYSYWPGHTAADQMARDYRRGWILGGQFGSQLSQQGAVGAVFILDASKAALDGDYVPFSDGPQGVPMLHVDRDTGAFLRKQAQSRPKVRFTLSATKAQTTTPDLTAVFPGAPGNDELVIVNTHTDGQNFAEENGGVMQVAIARYLQSIAVEKRPKRSTVFAAWSGHMAPDMPQAQGWIDDHPDLIAKAAAAVTIEHFGCEEWVDDLVNGYHYTGENEATGLWASQTPMTTIAIDTVRANDLGHTSVLRGPVQFGVGAAFESSAGIPQMGFIAGPNYLVAIADNGQMDKYDAVLARKQLRWTADVLHRIDQFDSQTLRTGLLFKS
jgi:hypothetical protein